MSNEIQFTININEKGICKLQKKILFISDHGDPLAPLGSEQAGGQNNYVKQLALALEKEGNRVDVVTHWADPADSRIEVFGDSCRVIRIAAGRKEYVPKNEMFNLLPDFYAEMKNTIQLASYDLVHTHYWLSGLLGSIVKKEYPMPWIHTNHSLGIAKEQVTGVQEPTRLSAEKLILSTADQIITTTENEVDLIRSFVNHPAPMSVVAIGVDDAFRPLQKQKEVAGNPYFAFAGRLEKTKGIYTLLHAFRRLVERDEVPHSAKLLIAGGDANSVDTVKKLPKHQALRATIEGLENRIDFIGGQSPNELASLFNGATGTVVPSQYESFGMVAAEAQACGCPVIASNVGGLKEVVKNRMTGLHIEKNDVQSLASAMKTLLTNQTYAKRLGMTAAAFANREYRWPALSRKINKLYEVTLNEKKNAYVGDGSRRYVGGRSGGATGTVAVLR